MPEYLSPGVYVEEFEIGAKPIEGVATSTAAFLGRTERGPLQPKLVTSWGQYERIYGGYRVGLVAPETEPNESLPLAVRAFFENGGARVYVTRIVKTPVDGAGGAATATPDATAAALGNVDYRASGPGAWGNRVFLRFSGIKAEEKVDPPPPATKFRLRVYYWSEPIDADKAFDPAEVLSADDKKKVAGLPRPTYVEDYDELDLQPSSPNFVEKRIDRTSVLVDLPSPGSPEIPSLDGKFLQMTNGSDAGALIADDYVGQPADPTKLRESSWGLTALREAPFEDVAIVYAPEKGADLSLRNLLVSHCEQMKYRFLVLDSAPNEADPGTLMPRNDIDTKYAAFYYPWIWIAHPENGRLLKVPPGGSVVGIYARSDVERGVWKAPANEPVRGALELEFDVTRGRQDVLNPRGVNVIRAFPGRGIRVWGARTLSSDPLWKYVNVRRLFIFLEASIDRGTQWIVFEPNNEALWARVRQTIAQFLRTQWRAGALMGLKEDEAFFVRADRTTMTQDDIDNGRLIVLIGVAPVKPAEFVIFRFAQFTGKAEA